MRGWVERRGQIPRYLRSCPAPALRSLPCGFILCIPSPRQHLTQGLSYIWNHTQLYITWMRSDLEDWCFLSSRADIILQFMRFQSPPPLTFLCTMFYMIIPGVFNTICFKTWRKTHFLLLLTVGYQSTEAFDSKTKQKANTWGQIMPSVESNCECGLKNWVESQGENDMDFLEQTEEKSRSKFSTSQLCHCPFKAFTVSVWWSWSKAMDTEVTLQ